MKNLCLKPCNACPFRKDIEHQHGWLGYNKARAIIDKFTLGDGLFVCHKTYDTENLACAGALILESRCNPLGNLQTRLLIKAGELNRDYSNLQGQETVFDTPQEFIDWHSGHAGEDE